MGVIAAETKREMRWKAWKAAFVVWFGVCMEAKKQDYLWRWGAECSKMEDWLCIQLMVVGENIA